MQASLRELDLGEIVCIPGLEDLDELARHAEVEAAVLQAGLRPPLATRYQATGRSVASEGPS